MEEYKQVGKEKLRMGYTTGSCAAAASKAAAQMLFLGAPIERVSLMTPKGIELDLKVEEICFDGVPVADGTVKRDGRISEVSCAIRKDSGDDPDVTNGVLVYSKVCLRDVDDGAAGAVGASQMAEAAGQVDSEKIHLDGGVGIGRVTKKGLEQPVGSAAINSVPRRMIREAVKEICEEQEYDGCLDVLISIPAGVELAKKTFNPNLGIEGGISVLGTSGIVEPMSEAALKESIRVELNMLAENFGKHLIFSPGNYGTHYVQNRWPEFAEGEIPLLKFSNYVGETLQFALGAELESILFVAHIGKFVKVAAGIMNTHSKEADARVEIMASAALRAGASAEVALRILDCTTTDAAIEVLLAEDGRGTASEASQAEDGSLLAGPDTLTGKTMQILLEKVLYHLNRKLGDDVEVGLVLFSNAYGTLAESENVEALLEKIRSHSKADD